MAAFGKLSDTLLDAEQMRALGMDKASIEMCLVGLTEDPAYAHRVGASLAMTARSHGTNEETGEPHYFAALMRESDGSVWIFVQCPSLEPGRNFWACGVKEWPADELELQATLIQCWYQFFLRNKWDMDVTELLHGSQYAYQAIEVN